MTPLNAHVNEVPAVLYCLTCKILPQFPPHYLAVPTNEQLNVAVTGSANSGELKYYNFPFHSSGLTFRLDVFQGSIIAYASHTTESPKPERGYNWTTQTTIYDDLFFSPASGSTVYVVLQGTQSSNSFRIGAIPEDFTTIGEFVLTVMYHVVCEVNTFFFLIIFHHKYDTVIT